MRIRSLVSASVVAGFVVGGLAASTSAAPLYSWEDAPETWAPVNASVTMSYDASTGVTHGEYSLRLDLSFPAAQWQVLQIQSTNGDSANIPLGGLTSDYVGKTIAVDVTTDATDLGIAVLLQGDVDGPGPGAFTSYNGQNDAVDISSPDGQLHTTTVLLDYSAFTALTGPVHGWSQARLLFRKMDWADATATTKTVYLDNYRLVPEPASAAMIGLAGMGMLTRRRR